MVVAAMLLAPRMGMAANEQDVLLVSIPENFKFAAAQYERLLESLKDDQKLPRTFIEGRVKTVEPRDWTSGFFPGSLWYLYEYTRDPKWLAAATNYTRRLAGIKDYRGSHDVGFILGCSYGNGYRLTGDSEYREVLIQGARSLATRFNPRVGAIRSWDHGKWNFPVIIDNLMNLELLLWSTRESGDPQFRKIAMSHADLTLANHFRSDASSFHVVDFNPTKGIVMARRTHQGAADGSAWARGQAWALYGYTMLFRETREPAYRRQAETIARFILNHPRLPADKVPYWDFDAPGIPDVPRDASAAAVMSSALIELSGLIDGELADRCLELGRQQLISLSSPAYRARPGENGNFLLMHSVGSLPSRSEVDVPLIYADYYFLEALLRYRARVNPTNSTTDVRNRFPVEAGAASDLDASARIGIEVADLERTRIMKAAGAALLLRPITITAFRAELSSGGPNDFYSNGDYHWPNPTNATGLPYVQRDGQSNPNNFNAHRLAMRRLRDAVSALGAAYRLTGDNRYAAKADELLRVFFLDPETRMNPHLEFAQAVPGVSPGRSWGIIDGLHLIEIPPAIAAMEKAPTFKRETLLGTKRWFAELTDWMLTSRNGRQEAVAKNNHSVAFWLQVATFARFTGDEANLSECRRQFKEVFVPNQMATDGSFPLELKRTKPYGYSIFQLENMTALCQVLSTPEDNLWDFALSDGRGIRKAMAWLYPCIADKSKWPLKPDVQAWDGWPARPSCLLFAGKALDNADYVRLWKRLSPDVKDEEVQRNLAITQPLLWIDWNAKADPRSSALNDGGVRN